MKRANQARSSKIIDWRVYCLSVNLIKLTGQLSYPNSSSVRQTMTWTLIRVLKSILQQGPTTQRLSLENTWWLSEVSLAPRTWVTSGLSTWRQKSGTNQQLRDRRVFSTKDSTLPVLSKRQKSLLLVDATQSTPTWMTSTYLRWKTSSCILRMLREFTTL